MKQLRIRLRSDTTFGRGDGVAGFLDDEVEYDPSTGLPCVKGRTVKGLVVEECSNLLYSVGKIGHPRLLEMEQRARRIFGSPGSTSEDEGVLHFGGAQFPTSVSLAVANAIRGGSVTADEVLRSWTAIRRRTAIDAEREAPSDETLRNLRVVMRKTVLYSDLVEMAPLDDDDWALVAACVQTVRRGGKTRNRGAGRLACAIVQDGTDSPADLSQRFAGILDSEGVPT